MKRKGSSSPISHHHPSSPCFPCTRTWQALPRTDLSHLFSKVNGIIFCQTASLSRPTEVPANTLFGSKVTAGHTVDSREEGQSSDNEHIWCGHLEPGAQPCVLFPDSRNASASGNVACGFGVSQAFGAQHCGRILCSSNPPLSPVMT